MLQFDFITFSWLFAISVTVHNIEEAIWLPRWSVAAGRWHHPVEPAVFRFAVLALTLFACIVPILATIGGKLSIGAYLVSGFALAMLLNVFFPHLIATVALRKYAPGLATAVVLNLPVTLGVLVAAVKEGYIDLQSFYLAGPAITLGIAGSIPVLFFIGKNLWGHSARHAPGASANAGGPMDLSKKNIDDRET